MKAITLRLVPAGDGRFLVRASRTTGRYTYDKNPIGTVAPNDQGGWSHSVPWSQVGPVYGNSKTKERAAQECYRSHRSWVGY